MAGSSRVRSKAVASLVAHCLSGHWRLAAMADSRWAGGVVARKKLPSFEYGAIAEVKGDSALLD